MKYLKEERRQASAVSSYLFSKVKIVAYQYQSLTKQVFWNYELQGRYMTGDSI